jgi:transcriptional regulator GlxA family with amidase domain
VIVPGVVAPRPWEIDAVLERPDARRAMRWLVQRHRAGALVLASCSSTFLLAAAGLLDGGPATTAWYLAPHFRKRFPRVDLREDAMVVAHGHVVTAGAALSHVDLMLWLVRHVAGPEIADRCARFLVLDDRPTQARYLAVDYLGARSREVIRAERYLREHLAEPVALADVARAASTSPRTIARRFEEALGMSPLRFLRRLRVERAEHLLETTRQSLDEVAARVGYADPITLRRQLRKELGRGAREIRARLSASRSS